ncbi:MAG: hypothetical protein IJ514_03325 [Clostridia bacterium]|nr:hypothetical protein [Clostridia bacterium]
MKNNVFHIQFNKATGSIENLSLACDEHDMNFVKEGATFGDVYVNFIIPEAWTYELLPLDLVEFYETDAYAQARYEKFGLTLETRYFFEGEDLKATYKLTNKNPYPYYFKNADVRLGTGFNDSFTGSEVCMKYCCQEHVWAAHQSSYIYAERMGLSKNSVGVFFDEGNFSGYTQRLPNLAYCNGSYRGELLMNVAPFSLLKDESYSFSFVIFKAPTREEFFERLRTFDHYLHVECESGYTCELGNDIRFSVTAKNEVETAECYLASEKLPFAINGKTVSVRYKPTTVGEKKIRFIINGVESYANFNVVLPIEELIEKRIDFIVDKQQCLDERSPLYGAYLLYDLKEERQYFHYVFPDHNACRERFGMPSLIAKWLQTHENEKWRKSLDLFIRFMFRECVNKETGMVTDTIFNDPERKRLYNVPWVMNLLDEMYKLTGDISYVDILIKVLRFYYTDANGAGARFYPDGCLFANSLQTIVDAGKKGEAQDVFEHFDRHVANIIDIGLNYPPHEVFYEQTIVSPAVTFLLDKYRLTKDESLLKEAEKHLAVLRRFDGFQPDHHLHHIAVRYWDNFWFGKSHFYADTFPHYWSAYSGVAFAYYGKLVGDEKAIRYGLECARNNLSLFDENGRGHAAYIYPDFINEREGKFLDDFANDQDFALYFLLQVLDLAK